MSEPNFDQRDGSIWQNGALRPWKDATVHVLTHTLHYGLGVFEGVRAYDTPKGPCIFRLREHTDRLFNSAHIMGIRMPYAKDEVNQAQLETVRANGLAEGYVRPMVYLGCEEMGLRADRLSVNLAIATWPWPDFMEGNAREEGVRVRTSSYTRHHVNISMCKAKANGQYINSILALQEALACGCDESLLLDNEGYVAEGSGENIFIVRDGILHTPELTSCLDGITRNTVFHLARDMGLEIRERRITRDELYICDEAFFTGTAAEVLPIRELDGRRIGNGKRGPLTEQLQSAYLDQVHGRRNAYPEWLAAV